MAPDIEVLLVAYLAELTGQRCLTDLPDDLDAILPVHRVACADGVDDGFRLDASIVDVDTFAGDRAQASELAEEARELLLELRGQPRSAGVVTGVRTLTKPHWLPDPNPNLRRFTASYQVYAHS